MKNKKLTAIVVAAALVANVVLFGLASADDTTSQVQITGGTVTIDVFPTMNFSDIDTSAADQLITSTGGPSSFQVEDLTSDGSTWDVTLEIAGSFLDWSTGRTIVLGEDGVDLRYDLDKDEADWADLDDTPTGNCLEATSGMAIEGLEGGIFFHDTNPQTIITADTTPRAINCGITPILEINVPGGTLSGTYHNTLTFTLTTY